MSRAFKTFSRITAAFAVTLSILWTASVGSAAVSCEGLFEGRRAAAVPKVQISEDEFGETTRQLRSTLTGNLATVWRSEWKTKLNVVASNHYVMALLRKFLTPHTQSLIFADLDPAKENFVRTLHARMYDLQSKGLAQQEDEIQVRDPPPPAGALDRTFTYYTKPLLSATGEGKHQLRIRTYMRELDPQSMIMNMAVNGFDMSGAPITITRLGADQFEVQAEMKSLELPGLQTDVLTTEQLKRRFGSPFYLFAPHGQNFKLEVKTALEEEISGDKFPLLGGNHMVQKLDVNLSMSQVARLFAPRDPKLEPEARREAARTDLEAIKAEVLANAPKTTARTEAVFEILADGLKESADFLQIEGATVYHRTAFESKSGFQTTIDRDQGVYIGQMYGPKGLITPGEKMLQKKLGSDGESDARHVEFKLPITSVQALLGFKNRPTDTTLSAPTSHQNERNTTALEIYYPYVLNADHAGKFNYLIRKANAVDARE